MVRYWAGEPVQVRWDNTKYRRYRIQVAKRAIAREKGERHVPTGYMVCCDVRARPSLYSPDIVGSSTSISKGPTQDGSWHEWWD